MSLIERLAGRKALTLNLLSRDGWTYDDGFMIPPSSIGYTDGKEAIDQSFESYVTEAYKSNGPVFACVLARQLPFSEARFQFQRMRAGRPGDLFGTSALSLLEQPWPNGTTGELLSRMEQDGSLAGNFYATVVGEGENKRVRRLRPDWVTIIAGTRGDSDNPFGLNAEVLGYVYDPSGNGENRTLLTPDRVIHYSPIPDPAMQWRGMSWLTPVLREIQADSATTLHKFKFFENGATPPFVIKYDASVSKETFQWAVEAFREQHAGVGNAYKILHIGGGADPTTVGTDFRQLDFKATQGVGETRIAAAAGVGAIIARLSEGMQGSSLNQGNYNAAKRQFADMTIRPLWRMAAAALSKPMLVDIPADARLWYDARDVAFLKEDEKDAAEIQGKEAATLTMLVREGFTPASSVAALTNRDWTLLEHTGKLSVQLQPVDAEPPVAEGGET
jgi:phage portal protein BeeE